jgi:hypothetical protein
VSPDAFSFFPFPGLTPWSGDYFFINDSSFETGSQPSVADYLKKILFFVTTLKERGLMIEEQQEVLLMDL